MNGTGRAGDNGGTRTRVLITNDDGVSAPGLRPLIAAAADHGLDVVVAAPLDESSGVSAALTAVLDGGQVVIRRRAGAVNGVPSFGVDASPAYIVLLATLGAFGEPPDLVISGVNRGANAGNAVLHSGTVGAALTAASTGRRAMAVSLDGLSASVASAARGGAAFAATQERDDAARHWDTAQAVASSLLPVLFAVPGGSVINVNVPDRPPAEVRGVRQAALARFGQVSMAIVESGEGYVRMSVQESEVVPDPDTDLALLGDGWATVTPIQAITAADGLDLRLADL